MDTCLFRILQERHVGDTWLLQVAACHVGRVWSDYTLACLSILGFDIFSRTYREEISQIYV
jgi:hypothetical protein